MHHPNPWHRGSIFGDGRRVPLDRNQRARFRYLLHAHHRAGRLTRAGRDAGKALLKRLGPDGRLDPSHETLAGDVACSESTIGRSLVRMRDLGLLRWQRRLTRIGWRAEQTSNAYELVPGAPAPMLPVRPPVCCDRQGDGETRFIEIQRPAIEVEVARKALERVRVAMEQRMLGNGFRMNS
jgi:hypothetical protein